jgi:hypothetical protein
VPRHRDRAVTLPDRHDRVEPEPLRHREPAVDRVDRPARHARADEQLEPLGRPAGRERSTSSGRSSSRLAVRSALRANRGSSGTCGMPSTSHSLRNCRSFAAATMRSRSAVGSGS